MSKVRIYEVARELDLGNEAVIGVCHSLGLADVNHHTNAVTREAAERVRRYVIEERKQRIRATVVRRRPRSAPVVGEVSSISESRPAVASPTAAPPKAESAVPQQMAPRRSTTPPSPSTTPPLTSRAPTTPPRETAKTMRQPAASTVVVGAPAARRPKTGIEVWEGRPGVPRPPRPPVRKKAAPEGTGRRQERNRRSTAPAGAPKQKAPERTPERAAHKKIIRIEGATTVQSLAARIGVKATELLKTLLRLGASGIHVNSTLDADTAKIVANELGWDVENVAVSETAAIEAARGRSTSTSMVDLEKRAPVVTVMGHVDHGKTTLLDRIRRTSVAANEAGGITQHIGAYSVETSRGRITFLDTPGHEAFTNMRARGAQCTDVVVLVVAADDGVMPQTRESVHHARAAGVPIVVALTKTDKPEARPERVRRELAEIGLVPETWGGETLSAEVSGVTGRGIDTLLEQILLQAELLDLKANPHVPARGLVVEAKLDPGKGPIATIIVVDGTLRDGDALLVGQTAGRVRAMYDDAGRPRKAAGPATPVTVTGLAEVPNAGDSVDVVAHISQAQAIAARRVQEERARTLAGTARLSLDALPKALGTTKERELRIVLKADVYGSVDALTAALKKLSSDSVRLSIVHSAPGGITENDVALAAASGAMIVGFNVKPVGNAQTLAERGGIVMRFFRVIYDLLDDVRNTMNGLLEPERIERPLGKAEVRRIFRVPKIGAVAGCVVTDGLVRRNASARVLRNGNALWQGSIATLRRLKDDVMEAKQGLECGVSLKGYDGIAEGDVLEVFEVRQV